MSIGLQITLIETKACIHVYALEPPSTGRERASRPRHRGTVLQPDYDVYTKALAEHFDDFNRLTNGSSSYP